MDLTAIAAAFQRGEGELLSDTRRSLVRRLPHPEGDVVVKEIRPRRGVRGVRERLRRLVGQTRGKTAAGAAERLRSLGLPVPEPLGRFEEGDRTILISRWVPGAPLSASTLLARLADVGRLVGRLHAAGAIHGDLKPTNLLLGPDDSLTLIDLDRVRFVTDADARARDLGRLEAAARKAGLASAARLEAWEGYLEVTGPQPGLLERVVARADLFA